MMAVQLCDCTAMLHCLLGKVILWYYYRQLSQVELLQAASGAGFRGSLAEDANVLETVLEAPLKKLYVFSKGRMEAGD